MPRRSWFPTACFDCGRKKSYKYTVSYLHTHTLRNSYTTHTQVRTSSSVCVFNDPQLEFCDWNRNENKNNNSNVNTRKKNLKKTTFVYNCWRELLKKLHIKNKTQKTCWKTLFYLVPPNISSTHTHANVSLHARNTRTVNVRAGRTIGLRLAICRWQHDARTTNTITHQRTPPTITHLSRLISPRMTIKESNKRKQWTVKYNICVNYYHMRNTNKTNQHRNIYI